MSRTFFGLLTVLLCGFPSILAADGTILAVFAHPDDETSVAPLLAKYAAEGHQVHLAIVTSGQVGDTHTDIPRGEELGAVREEEARCSCRALGIEPPHLMRFMDGSISDWQTIPKIRERLRSLIEEVKPEVIITWGPDGLSGHPDHRTVSNVTSEVFQHRSKLTHQPERLYYVAFPEQLMTQLPPQMAQQSGSMGLVDMRWVDTVVEAGEYLDRVWNSIQCHKTQWPPAMMEQMRQLQSSLLRGKVYLRLAMEYRPQGLATTIF
jgi:LmbE family N-acetylglucosaminyl deacetylase